MAEIDQMRQGFDNAPYSLHLGMKVVELSPGYSKIKLELTNKLQSLDNLIHGGVIVSLLDQAFGCAINALEDVYIAAQLNVHFLSVATVGDTIYSEARVLHAGRSVGVSEMTVVDSKGKIIARATGTAVPVGVRRQSLAGA